MAILQANTNHIVVDQLFDTSDSSYVTDAVLEATLARASVSGSITGVTAANPVVVTAPSHGLSNGDQVILWGVTGVTAANTVATVANKTDNTFELSGVNGSSGTTWEGGGKFAQVIDGLEAITLSYVSGSLAQYLGVIPGSVILRSGVDVWLIVRGTADSDPVEIVRREAVRERS